MHQFLFYIGDFPIRAYGLVLSLSIVLATGVAYFLAKQDGRWHHHIADMGIYCGLAGILGSRLWDVFFFDWDYYRDHLSEILNVWQGGMAIQGGIVLGAVVGILYTKRHGIDSWALADIVCPAVILGQALGRCALLPHLRRPAALARRDLGRAAGHGDFRVAPDVPHDFPREGAGVFSVCDPVFGSALFLGILPGGLRRSGAGTFHLGPDHQPDRRRSRRRRMALVRIFGKKKCFRRERGAKSLTHLRFRAYNEKKNSQRQGVYLWIRLSRAI